MSHEDRQAPTVDHHITHQQRGNRVEDFRLSTGGGKYASDWNAPGQLYGHFVRAELKPVLIKIAAQRSAQSARFADTRPTGGVCKMLVIGMLRKQNRTTSR